MLHGKVFPKKERRFIGTQSERRVSRGNSEGWEVVSTDFVISTAVVERERSRESSTFSSD
jgi:hypothetical protein